MFKYNNSHKTFLKNYLKEKFFWKNYHKKKLELGKVTFIVDDTIFNGIKVKSSFRMIMINQPFSNALRDHFEKQINKPFFNLNFYSILTLILFTLMVCFVLIPFFENFFNIYLYKHPNSDLLNSNMLNLIFDILDEDDDFLKFLLKNSSKKFNLLNFF